MRGEYRLKSTPIRSRRELRMNNTRAGINTAQPSRWFQNDIASDAYQTHSRSTDSTRPRSVTPRRNKLVPKTSRQEGERRSLRRVIAQTFAIVSTVGLLMGIVIPSFGTSDFSIVSTSMQKQELAVGGDISSSEMAMSDSLIASVEEVAAIGSGGKVTNIFALPNSKSRYPFDTEVPLTDGFGYRSAPVAGFHDAQDLAPGGGTPIRVVASGLVTEAGVAADGWCGFALTVQHQINGQDVESRYCHMQTNSHTYQVGDFVDIGDIAGRVGNTGLSFGNHLHLIVKKSGISVDPLPFLAASS